MSQNEAVADYNANLGITISYFGVYNAAKASLFAFLPLFYRELGLSLKETGILCGVKALIHILIIPCWAVYIRNLNTSKAIKTFLFVSAALSTAHYYLLVVPLPRYHDTACDKVIVAAPKAPEAASPPPTANHAPAAAPAHAASHAHAASSHRIGHKKKKPTNQDPMTDAGNSEVGLNFDNPYCHAAAYWNNHELVCCKQKKCRCTMPEDDDDDELVEIKDSLNDFIQEHDASKGKVDNTVGSLYGGSRIAESFGGHQKGGERGSEHEAMISEKIHGDGPRVHEEESHVRDKEPHLSDLSAAKKEKEPHLSAAKKEKGPHLSAQSAAKKEKGPHLSAQSEAKKEKGPHLSAQSAAKKEKEPHLSAQSAAQIEDQPHVDGQKALVEKQEGQLTGKIAQLHGSKEIHSKLQDTHGNAKELQVREKVSHVKGQESQVNSKKSSHLRIEKHVQLQEKQLQVAVQANHAKGKEHNAQLNKQANDQNARLNEKSNDQKPSVNEANHDQKAHLSRRSDHDNGLDGMDEELSQHWMSHYRMRREKKEEDTHKGQGPNHTGPVPQGGGEIKVISESGPFIPLLIIICVGSILIPPVKKTLDDSLFTFLDYHDRVGQHKYHQITGSFSTAITGLVVGIILSKIGCGLQSAVLGMRFNNHYHFCFLMFAIFMIVAILLTFCFPVMDQHQPLQLGMALRTICNDGSGRLLLYCITVVMIEATQACIYTFMIWNLRDLTKGYTADWIVGGAVAMSAFGEILMYFWGKYYVRMKFHYRTMMICIIMQAWRLAYYSYLKIGWTVVLAEMSHMLTSTLMWLNMYTYIDYVTPPFLERDVYFLVQTIFGGLGYGLGAIFGGMIASSVGIARLLGFSAGLMFIWLVLFFILSCCCRREPVQGKELMPTTEKAPY